MNKFTVFIKYLPIMALAFAVVYVNILLTDDTLFKKFKRSESGEFTQEDEIKIKKAELNRGLLVSIMSSVFLGVISAIFAQLKVPQDLIIFNYGFVFAPVLGFLLDIGFGKYDGLELYYKDTSEWSKHVISSLCSMKFIKYVITVFLDMFISSPIQEILQSLGSTLTNELRNGDFIAQFTSKNMPSIIQSIVAVITFNSYTNNTRFAWAYEEKQNKSNDLFIALATAISGVVFLIYNNSSVSMDKRMSYIVFIFGLLTLIDQFDEIDVSNREVYGSLILFMFVLYGVIYPLMNIKNLKLL